MFKLKGLDQAHSFFTDRGLTQETAAYFEAGYCRKGMMANRIAIPIHNEKGELVAYCGRAISQEQANQEGKYKMPPGFQKQKVVYNLNRQDPKMPALILVESFLSVFKLYQYGYKNVVALMGSVLSPDQEQMVISRVGPGGRVILLFDADEDGQGCAQDCLARLSRRAFVKAADISAYGRKPHHLSADQVSSLLTL